MAQQPPAANPATLDRIAHVAAGYAEKGVRDNWSELAGELKRGVSPDSLLPALVGYVRRAVVDGAYPQDRHGPQVELFDTDGTRDANGDVRIRVSLNGYLIGVERGIQEPDHEPTYGEERYGVNWVEFDTLIGRVLTQLDASISDPVQRKALKDVVKHAIKEWVAGIIQDAAADAGFVDRHVSAPWVGGVFASNLARPEAHVREGAPTEVG